MASVNKVIIVGNLGKPPEISYTTSGGAIAKLSVATTDKWNDKQSGEKKEKTEWHRVVFFGKTAEHCGKYLDKGSQVYVEGKLQTSSYEKDGITRYSTDIIGNIIQFLGGKTPNSNQHQHGNQSNQGMSQQQYQGGYNQQQYQGGYNQQQNNVPPDDDIPF